MIRQPFVYTPAMIRDPGGYCWRRGAHRAETRMRGTKIIHRADQIHPVLYGHRAACQRPTSTRQRCQTLTKGRVEPVTVDRRITPPTAVPGRVESRRAQRQVGSFRSVPFRLYSGFLVPP
jgi:hypothetical protein